MIRLTKIPEQVAAIGFSNWFTSQMITPKLSTVYKPSHEMGVRAFKCLLVEMNICKKGMPFIPKTIELETKIIERESSLKKNYTLFYKIDVPFNTFELSSF